MEHVVPFKITTINIVKSRITMQSHELYESSHSARVHSASIPSRAIFVTSLPTQLMYTVYSLASNTLSAKGVACETIPSNEPCTWCDHAILHLNLIIFAPVAPMNISIAIRYLSISKPQ